MQAARIGDVARKGLKYEQKLAKCKMDPDQVRATFFVEKVLQMDQLPSKMKAESHRSDRHFLEKTGGGGDACLIKGDAW